MATDARCTTAVATVMPISTGIGLEAGGEGQRHQLGLVAQLGDEDDAEADDQRGEETVHDVLPDQAGRRYRGALDPAATAWSKVSPASR